MIKYIIDKGVDLECDAIGKYKPIHFICKHSTPEMIKYIIDKGVDLECKTNLDLKPIHLICQYSTPEIIKYIIDKGDDLECKKKVSIRLSAYYYDAKWNMVYLKKKLT